MPTIIQPKLPRVQFYSRMPGDAYRPCNGTEGEYFHSMWCDNCARVAHGHREGRDAGDDDWCEILGRSFRSR